ncbi:putative outer membrane adhesin like proteiin [Streptomyces azureus]|uniref:Putative outer membrane adhesin like proteiin n=1 Tax=Streptomyces azureus TaxID=146537 RepID=A0A0K8PLT1_STRAJ|nr:putative outer membrane adhesin like proteiin [Streptomyces azureus]
MRPHRPQQVHEGLGRPGRWQAGEDRQRALPRRVGYEDDAAVADRVADEVGGRGADADTGGGHAYRRGGVLGEHGGARGEAGPAAGPVEETFAVDDGFHGAAHPGAVGEFGQCHRRTAGKTVVEGHHEDDVLLTDRHDGARPVGGRRTDTEIGGAALDLLLQGLGGRVLVEVQQHARMGGVPAGEDVREDTDRDGVDGGDMQFAALRTGGGAGRAAGLRGAAHGEFGVRPEGASHRGQADPARHALQQRAADRPFQGLDLVGERGLRDVQELGRAGEGRLLDDRQEVLHLPQAHVRPLP